MSLAGKTALISGAGGSIGAAIAGRLHHDGARIVAVDIAAAGLAALRYAIPDVVTVISRCVDIAGADMALAAAGGCVDILLNNAGISDGGGAIDELDELVWIA